MQLGSFWGRRENSGTGAETLSLSSDTWLPSSKKHYGIGISAHEDNTGLKHAASKHYAES